MTSKAKESSDSGSSSEDECLSDLKRKISETTRNDSVFPGELLEIQMDEIDVLDNAVRFAKQLSQAKTTDEPPPKKKRKDVRKRKRKFKPRKKKHLCTKCDSKFYSLPALKAHILTHQIETRHYCEKCGRYFKKAFSLRFHQRIHDAKEEKCPLCEMSFPMKIHLQRHLMRHEKTEKCEKCPAAFHTREQLEEHIKTHEGDQSSQSEDTQEAAKEQAKTGDVLLISNTQEHCFIKEEVDSDGMAVDGDTADSDPLRPAETIFSKEDLSFEIQAAIVNKMHKGRSVADICKIYNVTPEIVNELWEDRDNFTLLKKVGRNSLKEMNSILDAQLLEWFNKQRQKDIQVTGKMLQDAAEGFAKANGFLAFDAGKKWMERFKKKYSINFKGPSKRDYKNITAECKWKNHFFEEQWLDASLGFKKEDIYTGDEIGLYYNPSKGRIKKVGGRKYIHGYAKDRFSIFVCANMTGTDKRKLLVCGTEDPLLHSYRDPETLPVIYIRHCEGHFTTPMFEEYVKHWNKELKSLNKNAILVLDRATIHSKLTLSNLKLVFVPWKASSSLMPVKHGIYNRLRDEFRQLVLEERAMNVLRGMDRNLTCLEALNMLKKAWERTPSDVITKGFEIAGFDVKDIKHENIEIEKPKVTENDEEMLCKKLEDYDVEPYVTDLAQLDQYLMVEEELLTGQGTNVSVFGGNHKVKPIVFDKKEIEDILPIGSEKPESKELETLIKNKRALEDLEIVRKYLQSIDTTYETYCAFMDVEKFVLEKTT